MSELVTLGKKVCGICGRKDCNNPGWPSWGCMECYRIGYEREKARADEAEAALRQIAAALRAAESEALERAMETVREMMAGYSRNDESALVLNGLLTLLRALKPDPAAAPAAETRHNEVRVLVEPCEIGGHYRNENGVTFHPSKCTGEGR